MAAKAILQIGLDAKGKVVEIRVKGRKVKANMNSKHKCAPGTKTVVLRLKFCKPSEHKGGTSTTKEPPEGPIPPCCMVAGGRLICWPPCV